MSMSSLRPASQATSSKRTRSIKHALAILMRDDIKLSAEISRARAICKDDDVDGLRSLLGNALIAHTAASSPQLLDAVDPVHGD